MSQTETRLWRATGCGKRAKFTKLTWWATEEDDARAYTEDPGYGGPCLYSGIFDTSRTLDLTLGEPHYSWDDSHAIIRLADELFDDDEESGLDFVDDVRGQYIHDVLEQKDITSVLSDEYDWVKIYDTYPEGAETWLRLVPFSPEERRTIAKET